MKAPTTLLDASENLLQTYRALGKAIPNSSMTEEDGFHLCSNPDDHPVCNFAAQLSLHSNAAAHLTRLAKDRQSFHVYRLPEEEPRYNADLLEHAGFSIVHKLSQLRSRHQNFSTMPFGLTPTWMLSVSERSRIASFMADQFFSRQTSRFRQRVIEASVRANELSLIEFSIRNKTIGAVMLCETERTLGFYNLCVTASHRGRGYGSDIVRWVAHQAALRQKALVLQCEPSLREWYLEKGFEQVGTVEVYKFWL